MSTTGRAVRHTTRTRARVVELHDAGWGPAGIQRVLKQEGFAVPSRNTLWVWTHPKPAVLDAARHRHQQRRRRRQQSTFAWPGVRSDDWKLGRMSAMLAAGMSPTAIACVMTLDFPQDPITAEQVRATLVDITAPAGAYCKSCGDDLPPRHAGPGRRRKYCAQCRPSMSVVDNRAASLTGRECGRFTVPVVLARRTPRPSRACCSASGRSRTSRGRGGARRSPAVSAPCSSHGTRLAPGVRIP